VGAFFFFILQQGEPSISSRIRLRLLLQLLLLLLLLRIACNGLYLLRALPLGNIFRPRRRLLREVSLLACSFVQRPVKYSFSRSAHFVSSVCFVSSSTAAFVYLLVPKEKRADGSPPTYFWQTNPGLPPTHFWQTAPPEAMVAGQPAASQQQLGTYQPQCHAPPPPSARSLQQQQQPVVVIAQPIEHCEY
jgi:hypothetical protein